MQCAHENFACNVAVGRLTTAGVVTSYVAEVTVQCADCNERFVFEGLPLGSIPGIATSSIFGHEARLPIRPASAAFRELEEQLG